MKTTRGMRISLGMHAVLLLLVIFGLPAFFEAKREEEPLVISMEILPVSEITNVKAASKAPAPVQEAPKEQPKPVEEPKEQPPEPPKPTPPTKSEPTPPEPSPRELISPDAPKVEEKKKEPEKPKDEPKPKKEEPKKEKPKEDDLASILKDVAKAAKKETPQAPPNKKEDAKQTSPAQEQSDKQAISQNYDASMPLSMSERDAIKSQIMRCWSVPAGARDAQNLIVVLNIRFNQDGSLAAIPTLAEDQGRLSDPYFRAAADAAIRAVRRCTPLQGMPANRYGSWQNVELEFDPSKMLY